MIQENKINKKKGFTLAELLVVVAIIAVLVAISIPIFTSQLEKSRLATNQANARAAKAAAVIEYMNTDQNAAATYNYDVATGKATSGATATATDTVGGTTPNVSISTWKTDTTVGSSTLGKTAYTGTWTVVLNASGAVTSYAAK